MKIENGIWYDEKTIDFEKVLAKVKELFLFEDEYGRYANRNLLVKGDKIYIRMVDSNLYSQNKGIFYHLAIGCYSEDFITFNDDYYFEIDYDKIKELIEIAKQFIGLSEEYRIFIRRDSFINIYFGDKIISINKSNYKAIQKQIFNSMENKWNIIKNWNFAEN